MASSVRQNYKINQLYVRQEFEKCLDLIEKVLEETNNVCEYALHVKALIKRQQGSIHESLELFQQATSLNPHNVANLKQVGRSLVLLGKHKAAIDMYEEAQKMTAPDWEIMHNKGMCLVHLKHYNKAIECFRVALDIQPHDSTFIQLGKVYSTMHNHQAAMDVYGEALEHSPENTEILTTLGILFLRANETELAFSHLSNSLSHDPKNPRTILAVGSIIQVGKQSCMCSPVFGGLLLAGGQQWQVATSGKCLFAPCLQRCIAAIACLKKALYLGPFDWIVAYNLGLVYLNTGQPASAFHHLSASINLKPGFAHSYMYLAIALTQLGDTENACLSYEKAIQLVREGWALVFQICMQPSC
ncbi:Bardet-Biedl syndrome protein 4 [Dunaliella salina]|uniref:Bardet-Biedl syndrome protein 4 n=1 Tax=Dunaliella salina TaxID=3046 RepID=A0ABQ7H3X7_DUNSA|nr:Bardet-Biedl syndrome protein 4 [Dunaliella salina]|eukprot:KAF5841559.1 Bardet-Biedl syndrome protein 4 [Dunaliella salina]